PLTESVDPLLVNVAVYVRPSPGMALCWLTPKPRLSWGLSFAPETDCPAWTLSMRMVPPPLRATWPTTTGSSTSSSWVPEPPSSPLAAYTAPPRNRWLGLPLPDEEMDEPSTRSKKTLIPASAPLVGEVRWRV